MGQTRVARMQEGLGSGPIGSVILQDDTPSASGTIPETLDGLQKQLASLHEALQLLEEHMDPVLRPGPCALSGETLKTSVEQSQVTRAIVSACDSLDLATQRVRGLHHRLEA